ncbi:MAG: Bug family tripartite tricarboxylate transporter substrate binding protein [Burkholderiales bacterium]
MKRTQVATAMLAVALCGIALDAFAQDWPQRPVRLIVPFPPGGVTDNIARASADWLTRRLGQNVIVENRPGASGAIAGDVVAKAPADGYTLLMASLPPMAILPAMTRTPYDSVKDFAPITIVGANVFGLAVHRSLPVDTLPKFVSFVKARPGQVSYASAGSGTVSHLTMALFIQRAGLDMVHVPYKGGGPAVADALAGHVSLYFGNLSEVIPHASGARIRVLAVSGEKRASQLPDVPTVAESGYPGFRTSTWNGIAAPARTPQAIIERIAREMQPAANDAGFTGKLQVIGVDAICGTPEEFARTLKSDMATWAEAVRISGARIE